MGVEGLDNKYPRGKYPRESWPWHRPDPHDDVLLQDWARPDEWDGTSVYNGVNKLNTSIYELYVSEQPCICSQDARKFCISAFINLSAAPVCSVIGRQLGDHWWPIANFEFPNFLHYYRASLVKLYALLCDVK